MNCIRCIYLLLFLNIFTFGWSQRIISKKELSLKSNLNERRESITIVDDKENSFSILIADRKNLHLNKYDDSYTIVEDFVFERPKTRAKNIICAIKKDKNHLLLLDNEKKTFFQLLYFDSSSRTHELKSNSIFDKGEIYLKSFTHNSYIYLLTLKKNTSVINTYKIDALGDITSLNYNFSDEIFYNKNNKIVSLYELLFDTHTIVHKPKLEIIENDLPVSLESACKIRKLYKKDDRFYITLDHNNNFTYIIVLDPNSANSKVLNIEKPQLLYTENKNSSVKSNSYLFEDRLYQIVGESEQMCFFVKTIDSKKLIKQIHLRKNDSILFKNTPIIQDGGYYSKHREMEKTSKFLRKISSGNIGVTVRHHNNLFEITMGGVKTSKGGGFGAPMPMMGGMPMGNGALPMMPMYHNTMWLSYIGYIGSKSTHIKGLFNSSIEHIEGEIHPNIFEQIKEYADELLNKKAETIFSFKEDYIHAYYDSMSRKYILTKFENK
ncbi:hypothetical protein J8281_13300 [Aquimarina sp. U1-2]|uniref:hypothetical protein n=1 Tax=Aquimarina sp. U1-2 TaxID=2823141 RepID=UPI001AECC1A7|nr:hypothetical protein [Aquimarina sp. U1-2]MBP2833164.1 hypothetical protein [Aquimarina sp. U1-2]